MTGNAAVSVAERWGEPPAITNGRGRPPAARRCGKTGQTGFATTHAVGPFDVWFWFDRISPLAVAFVRVEHVERVVARGLLDDEHEAIGRALDRHAGNGLHVNV